MEAWRAVARRQDNVVNRAQLTAAGADRRMIRRRIDSGDWSAFGPRVVMTAPGVPTHSQRVRIGMLHPTGPALIVGRAGMALHGLTGWENGVIVVLVGSGDRSNRQPLDGITYARTRLGLNSLSVRRKGLATARVEFTALMLASAMADGRWGENRSQRSAGGLLAATVQQHVTTTDALLQSLVALPRLPHAPLLRAFVRDISGGSHSMAEIDLVRECRRFGLAPPKRQRPRWDSAGRKRYIDAEWELPDGRIVMLEVDGGLHLTSESHTDDLRRQRRLGGRGHHVLRCSAMELRAEPEQVMRDLVAAGVPLTNGVAWDPQCHKRY